MPKTKYPEEKKLKKRFFRSTDQEWEEFKRICAELSMRPSTVLLIYIREFIEKHKI